MKSTKYNWIISYFMSDCEGKVKEAAMKISQAVTSFTDYQKMNLGKKNTIKNYG